MGQNRRLQTHKRAKEIINQLYDGSAFGLIIHYSCESFYDIKDGRTPRITSIAVRHLKTAQTKSFSIHKVAELKRIPLKEVNENYDSLEKEMLQDFFGVLKEHKDSNWIHWNMRDINYGFEALQYRATLLEAEPFAIQDERKFDLARLLIDKYGKEYSDHPRLPSILEMNKISPKHWLNGAEEAEAFDNKEYVKLHQSTLAKVDVIETILKLSAEENLKTKSKWKDLYGITPQGVFEQIKDNWLYSLILFIISIFIGAYISQNIWH
jgi:hypothetical protein